MTDVDNKVLGSQLLPVADPWRLNELTVCKISILGMQYWVDRACGEGQGRGQRIEGMIGILLHLLYSKGNISIPSGFWRRIVCSRGPSPGLFQHF
jgi:hypothetical protein